MKYHIKFDLDFKRNPYKGIYIVLEGLDGSGKTEQTEALATYYKEKGKDSIVTHEPRKEGSIFSNLIHQILLGNLKVSPIALQYLFSADREQNHVETVIPALQAGKIVISHRSFWSIVPYAISNLDPKLYEDSAQFLLVANSILSMYHQFIIPDYTFFLDVSVEVAIKRLTERKGKQKEFYEKEDKLKKHAIGYEWLLKTFPNEFTRVDGVRSVQEVADQIIQIIQMGSGHK